MVYLPPAEEWRWDVFARSHPRRSIFQFDCWRAVLQSAFRHLRGRPLVVRDVASETIVAGTMVYEATSWLLGRRLISVPFASYMDPLVSEPWQISAIARSLSSTKAVGRYRHAELRLLKVKEAPCFGFVMRHPFKHHYLDLTQGTETLHRRFSRTAIRHRIRDADRDGVVVRSGGEDDWDRFWRLHRNARRRLGLPVMPRRFFDALRYHLSLDNLSLLFAEQNGKAIAASLALVFDGVYLYEWTGDSRDAHSKGARQRLLWGAMCDAADRRCHTFSLGRTDVNNTGLLAYKRRWRPTEEDVVILTSEDAEAQLVHRDRRHDWFARGLMRRVPDPMYSVMSEFCYRHLG